MFDDSIDTAGKFVDRVSSNTVGFLGDTVSKLSEAVGFSRAIGKGGYGDSGNGSVPGTPSLKYPLDLLSDGGRHPFMEIVSFKYKRDMKSVSNWHNSWGPSGIYATQKTDVPGVELNYVLRLPLQPAIANGVMNAFTETEGSHNAQAGAIMRAVTKAGNEQLGGGNGVDDLSSSANYLKGLASDAFSSKEEALQTLISLFTGRLGLNEGLAINPAIEVAYCRTQLKKHQFDITMIPRSKDEAFEIERIVYYLQKFSLGSIDTAKTLGLLTEYPALHEVRFYAWEKQTTGLVDVDGGGFLDKFIDEVTDAISDSLLGSDRKSETWVPKEIPGIIRIPDSFIESINVIQNPLPAARLTSDNRPLATRISISLQEIKAISREDFDQVFVKSKNYENNQ